MFQHSSICFLTQLKQLFLQFRFYQTCNFCDQFVAQDLTYNLPLHACIPFVPFFGLYVHNLHLNLLQTCRHHHPHLNDLFLHLLLNPSFDIFFLREVLLLIRFFVFFHTPQNLHYLPSLPLALPFYVFLLLHQLSFQLLFLHVLYDHLLQAFGFHFMLEVCLFL